MKKVYLIVQLKQDVSKQDETANPSGANQI